MSYESDNAKSEKEYQKEKAYAPDPAAGELLPGGGDRLVLPVGRQRKPLAPGLWYPVGGGAYGADPCTAGKSRPDCLWHQLFPFRRLYHCADRLFSPVWQHDVGVGVSVCQRRFRILFCSAELSHQLVAQRGGAAGAGCAECVALPPVADGLAFEHPLRCGGLLRRLRLCAAAPGSVHP